MTRTIRTRTNQLTAGVTVEFGDMYTGFSYATVLGINTIKDRPLKRTVTIQFAHGGVAEFVEGVTSIWSVVRIAA